MLVNPALVTDDNMPKFLMPTFLCGWDRVACPELMDTCFASAHPRSSVWIGIADKRQSQRRTGAPATYR
jgi:scyllo-inosamine-4-phosphate amidinotransferase 1